MMNKKLNEMQKYSILIETNSIRKIFQYMIEETKKNVNGNNFICDESFFIIHQIEEDLGMSKTTVHNALQFLSKIGVVLKFEDSGRTNEYCINVAESHSI